MASMLEFGINMSMLMGGNFVPEATKAGQALSNLQKHAQGLQKLSGRMQAFQKQQSRLELSREKLVQARENVRRLREEFKRTSHPTEEMRKKFADAQKQAGLLGADFQAQQKKLAELNSELQKSGVNTSKLISEQGRLASETDKVRAAQDRLTRAQEKYSSIRGKLSWGNMKGDILTSMGTLKVLQAPVTVSMNYEQAMSQVKAVANPNEEQYQALRAQSLELGRTTQFSAIQAANSQENLARAGFTVDKILAMMPEVLNVAAADGMELAQAADIVGGNLRGFNLAADQAQRISDILAFTSSSSATNVAMAGAALQGISGTAAVQGITPEQAASYIGVLANRANLQGTEAATTLERSISALAMRKGDTDKILKQYGIATKTRSGRMRMLEDIVEELYDKTIAKGPNDLQNAFMGVFGKAYGGDMMKLAIAVKENEVAKLQKGLMTNKTGAAAQMARTRNDNLKGDLTGLSSAWEGFMESVGNPLQDWSRTIVQGITNALNKITSFIKENEKLAELVIKIGAGIAAWKVGMTAFKYGGLLLQLPKAWLDMRLAEHAANMATIAGNAGTLAGNIDNASKAAGIFGVSLSSILGTVGLIALACYEIYQHWEQITAWATKAGEAISSIDTGKIQAAKVGSLSRSDIDYGVSVMSSTYMPPSIKNATGGIYTRPIWTWAAERGAEAIIPLTDKARGIPLLMQAAQMLGLTRNDTTITHPDSTLTANQSAMTQASNLPANQSAMTQGNTLTQNHTAMTQAASSITENTSLIQAANYIGGITHAGRFDDVHNIRGGNSDNSTHPTVNLTVNISGDTQDMSIAEKIKQAVIDALNEITSRQERLAYA